MPSYSRCASPIVRLTLKRSFRAASCCSGEVMNGGTGKRRFSFVATESTRYSLPSTAATIACAAASSPIATFTPSRLARLVFSSGGFLPFRWTSIDQYSCLTKARISRSRSTISRSATVCTRPADNPRRTLSHSNGEIL